MRILLVTYHYPPDPAVGGIRAARIARTLARAGHDVHVIASEFPGAASGEDAGVRIDRIRSGAGIRGVLAGRRADPGAKGSTSASPAKTDTDSDRSQQGYAIPARVPLWKRAIFSLMWLPDDRQGFISPAVRAGRAAAGAHGFDLIYSTAPPHSVHLAGFRLHRALGIPWIAEYRDPWTDGPGKPHHVRTRVTDWIERRLEEACLRRASRVVAVTRATADRLSARLASKGAPPATLIRNGIERIVEAPDRSDAGPIRIVYLGDLYLHRDPRLFLEALARLRRDGRLERGAVRVDLIGSCRFFHETSVEGLARELGVDDVVRIHDRVPHSEVPGILRDSDILLLFAQNQPDQVPNKLYEYLGSQRTVLAFADDRGESAALLREAGAHFVVTEKDDVDAAANVLQQSIHDARRDHAGHARVLEDLSTERQFTRLLALAEEVGS